MNDLPTECSNDGKMKRIGFENGYNLNISISFLTKITEGDEKIMIMRETAQDRIIHIRLPEDVHRRMRVHVAELDTTIQHWVASLVEKELSKIQALGAEKDHG